MIKAVFFDFYNTVGRFWPPREELQATACGEFGIEVTPDGVDVGYSLADAYMAREVARLPLRDRDRQGVKDFFSEYQRLILQGAGVEVSLELALKISARFAGSFPTDTLSSTMSSPLWTCSRSGDLSSVCSPTTRVI